MAEIVGLEKVIHVGFGGIGKIDEAPAAPHCPPDGIRHTGEGVAQHPVPDRQKFHGGELVIRHFLQECEPFSGCDLSGLQSVAQVQRLFRVKEGADQPEALNDPLRMDGDTDPADVQGNDPVHPIPPVILRTRLSSSSRGSAPVTMLRLASRIA